MKALLNCTTNMSVEVEGETAADLFEQISVAQEVFTHEKCGCCGKTDFRFVVRMDDEENKYYELQCKAYDEKNKGFCRAKLQFGCLKKPKGGLFAKRHFGSLSESDLKNRGLDKDNPPQNKYLPNGGWYKWVAKKEEDNNN